MARRSLASMTVYTTVDLYEWGSRIVVGFGRGSVVLDRSQGSIFELTEPAALALDVIADRPSTASRGHREPLFAAARSAMPTVVRELLGEGKFGRGHQVTLDDTGGQPLLRRFSEPVSWQRSRDGSPPSRSMLAVGSVRVRTATGAIVLLGESRRDRDALRKACVALGVDAVGREGLEVSQSGEEGEPLAVPWREDIDSVREVWLLKVAPSDNLVLQHLGGASAFAGVLALLDTAPDRRQLESLALTCATTPHFGATVPSSAAALAAKLRGYGTPVHVRPVRRRGRR